MIVEGKQVEKDGLKISKWKKKEVKGNLFHS